MVALQPGTKPFVSDASSANGTADFEVDHSRVIELLSNKRSLDYNSSMPELNRIGTNDDADLEVMSTHSAGRDETDYQSHAQPRTCNTFLFRYRACKRK